MQHVVEELVNYMGILFQINVVLQTEAHTSSQSSIPSNLP